MSWLDVDINGVRLSLLPDGAVWWAEAKLLVVSDLHLEKGSRHAVGGQMLPPYDTASTLETVSRLCGALQPDTVVSLGDSFHDGRALERMGEQDVARIRRLTARCDWWWVEGNHDPDPPEGLGGRAASVLDLDPLVFRHEPSVERPAGEICGHYHPCARVVGRAGRSVRTRCFVYDDRHMIVPAMGAFTGGLNVCEPVVQALFSGALQVAVAGRDGVYPVLADRLIGDTGQQSARRPW